MQKSRFVLSLVVALSLSTLALANSAPVNLKTFHSSGSVASSAFSSGHLSGTQAKTMPTGFGHSADFKPSGNTFVGLAHGTISHKDGNWAVWHKGSQPLSTPEPGSLMLLSTGLVGIAGTVRRKLKR